MKADGEDAAKELIFSAPKLSGGGGMFGYSLLSRIAGDMEILLVRPFLGFVIIVFGHGLHVIRVMLQMFSGRRRRGWAP